MDQINQQLESRRARLGPGGLRAAVGISGALHLVIVAALLLVPGLLHSDPPRIEYVEVVSIPAANLEQGRVPQPETRRTPPPPPDPEPEPEPEPPAEVPEDIPQLAPEDPPEDEPEPEPVREPEPSPDPAPADADDEPSDLPVEDDPLPAASKGEVDDTTVAGFDDPDFTYDYYSHQLIRAIGQAWRRPRIDRRLDLAIKFRIARNGTVTDVEVVRTSGIPSYDRAGIRALEDASPLPPLPVAYRKPSLGVTVLLP